MNMVGSKVVASVAKMAGHDVCEDENEADAILLNTCSVCENAENKIYNRLEALHAEQKKRRNLILSVLGCMAERVRDGLVQNRHANLMCGSDSYLNLPNMIAQCENGTNVSSVGLSTTKAYRDVIPQRTGDDKASSFAGIMRGCNNLCHCYIVPSTRGRECSRDVESILREVKDLHDKGLKEATFLGQNVSSCGLLSNGKHPENGVPFTELSHKVAQSVPDMRIRFTASNPENMTEDTIRTVTTKPNLCNHIHLPTQGGSNSVLEVVNRRYTREDYLEKVATIRRLVPGCGLTTDIFIGYHNGLEEDFQRTLSLMREVGFDSAFMLKYSERPGTYAARRLPDNIPEEEKTRRLDKSIRPQTEISTEQNKKDEDKELDILIERFGKRSRKQLVGRTPQNKAIVMSRDNHYISETVRVRITGLTNATFFGEEA